MNTSHSALQISVIKRALTRLTGFTSQYKYFLLAGILALAVPVVATLTFAEEGEENGDISVIQDESDELIGDDELSGGESEKEEIDEEEGTANEDMEEDADDEDEIEPEVKDELEDAEDEHSIKDYLIEDFRARNTSSSGKIALRMPNSFGGASRSLSRGVGTGSESYYNSREQSFGYDIRVKNQNSENLCWVYAMTSPIEYYVARNGLAVNSAEKEISPKHIDYQNVSASNAYKVGDVAAGRTNLLYDRLTTTGHERELGGAADVYNMLVALMNPLGLMNERDFTGVVKSNDSRLSAISKYEDIWNLSLNVLDGKGAYSEKQNHADMNDERATTFVVTGADFAFDSDYGESSTKTAIVNTIKNNIKKYGAVSVATFVDPDNCMYIDYDKDGDGNPVPDENGVYQVDGTIIDRGYDVSSQSFVCRSEMAHQMTIVGWDDNWAYKDNGVDKLGAFILQNSYGEEPHENMVTSGDDIVTILEHDNFYIGYNSAFNELLTFNSVERLDSYDHYYSVDDYEQAAIEAGSKELVFEFNSHGHELLKTLSFSAIMDDGRENYDVYVSRDGTVDGFVKNGSINAYFGVNKYTFAGDVEVDGEYAIKLVAERDMNNFDRSIEVVNVFTVDAPRETTFTLTLDSNGGLFPDGSVITTSCTTTETNCEVTVPDVAPTKADKIFEGWADSAEASEKQYDANSRITLNEDKAIYAVFADKSEPQPGPEPPVQSDNAYLSSLEVQYKVNGVIKYAEIEPEFDGEITEYEVVIPAGYDKGAFEDGLDVLVIGDTEDESATVYTESTVVDEDVKVMTITITAEDGTERVYDLFVYLEDVIVPDVPDTSGDTVPNVPNTGFKLKRDFERANYHSNGVLALIVVTGIVVLGVAARRSKLKKVEVNSESIIFVDKRL